MLIVLALFSSLLFSSSSFAETCTVKINGAPHVEWTAFKFTEKKGVKGQFKNVEFTAPEVSSVEELLSHISFVIDPAKVDSGDKGRDENLRTSFFKLMKGSGTIRGHVVSYDKEKSSLKVQLHMNGVTKVVPFQLKQEALSSVTKISKKENGSDKKKSKSKTKTLTYVAQGEIDILDFRMQKSLDALNKVCLDLHKGADGVSKTWSQVELTVSGQALESCAN
jgi:polyisoprenoid-binding protein YceI